MKNVEPQDCVLQRTKRSSKIPCALKDQFLKTMVSENLTIKDAAMRYRLNYSTAKAIAKENKKYYLERSTKSDDEYEAENQGIAKKQKQQTVQRGPTCTYTEINKQQDGSKNHKQRLTVVSTVAWDFLTKGLP